MDGSGSADNFARMSESEGQIARAVSEAISAGEHRRALLEQRNRLGRLIYWTDRMIEGLEALNQASERRVGPEPIENLEALAGAVPFAWEVRSTRRKVLDEVFEIQARLLELKIGGHTADMRRFDESVDDYYTWAEYSQDTPA